MSLLIPPPLNYPVEKQVRLYFLHSAVRMEDIDRLTRISGGGVGRGGISHETFTADRHENVLLWE